MKNNTQIRRGNTVSIVNKSQRVRHYDLSGDESAWAAAAARIGLP